MMLVMYAILSDILLMISV